MTQHDSMFKNISLPGGISTKATEYKELAAKGEKWESPVFSIGTAKESTNLPKVSEPRRKAHSSTPGGLVDGKPTTNGFATQMNDAFQSPGQDLGLNSGTGVNSDQANTTLGRGNPVLQGSV